MNTTCCFRVPASVEQAEQSRGRSESKPIIMYAHRPLLRATKSVPHGFRTQPTAELLHQEHFRVYISECCGISLNVGIRKNSEIARTFLHTWSIIFCTDSIPTCLATKCSFQLKFFSRFMICFLNLKKKSTLDFCEG